MRRYPAPPVTVPRIVLRPIPNGYAGTLRTAAHVKRLIREGAKDFYVRQGAIDILLARGVRPKDYLGEIAALFRWVQRHVRYTKDPFRVEVLHAPRRMLELRAGDCDDMTILLGSMLESIGHPVRLVLTGPDPRRPRLFSHIYLEVNHRGRWIPCDATMPHPLGWWPHAPVRQVIPIQEEPTHVTRGDRVEGRAERAARGGLATRTHPRNRTRGSQGQRPRGEAAVGSAPEPGPARSQRVAQAPAAVHLGEGACRTPAAQDDAAGQVAAPALGNSGPDRGAGAPGRAGVTGPDGWGSAASPASAGSGAAGGTGAAGRVVGQTALSQPGTALQRREPAELSGYLRECGDLYRRFNRFDPARVTRVLHTRLIPPVVVQLGELVGLIYRSDKWEPGAPRTYIHFMRQRPRLVCDARGRQLFVLGGAYRVTARGIEG